MDDTLGAGGIAGQIDQDNTCTLGISNDSTAHLYFHSSHHDHGQFSEPPPREIESGSHRFVFTRDTPGSFMTGSAGRLTFYVSYDGHHDTFWTVYWSNPTIGTNEGGTKLEGFHAEQFTSAPVNAPPSGSHITIDYQLSGGPGTPWWDNIGPLKLPPGFDPLPTGGPTLQFGDADEWVAQLQQMLNAIGYGPLAVDGSFGPATHTEVTGFQQANGLAPDGVVGQHTWAALTWRGT